MFDPAKDGIDHINIYFKSKVPLGWAMSNFTRFPMIIEDRLFHSIEGYWYWLFTGRKYDEFFDLSGYNAKKEGKKYLVVQIDNFEELIKKALRIKVESWKRLRLMLAESTLPFAHYYVFGDNPPIVRDAGFKWIVEEWEKIRKELKDGQRNC